MGTEGLFDYIPAWSREAVVGKVHLGELGYDFATPPLLVGGLAMEYYGLRMAGADTDLVVTEGDYHGLAQRHPQHLKDLAGDLGVCIHGFEVWRSIWMMGYDYLSDGAHDEGAFRVVSFERLLVMRVAAMTQTKYHDDLLLMRDRMAQIMYGT